jgi:hypothetical protein
MRRLLTLHVRAADGAWVVERDGATSCTFHRADSAVTYAVGLATHLRTMLDRPHVQVHVTNQHGRAYRVR